MTIACPSCSQQMLRRAFERKLQGVLELDLCHACKGIWFDPYESAQLTPGAVMELFREIHEHEDQPPRPLGADLRCPACHSQLALTHDVERTNKITYYRCPNAHGRLTTFVQFLREKNFVRSLTPPEVMQLKATVAQVRCSSCGAPIDLARDAACSYCHAPISILDADAVKRTLAELSSAERARRYVDPTAAIDGLLAGKRVGSRLAQIDAEAPARYEWGVISSTLVDLVGDAIGSLIPD